MSLSVKISWSGRIASGLSVESPFLFILYLILDPLSRESRSRYPKQLLYADDLPFQGLKRRLEAWEGTLQSKEVRVNFKKKLKIMISSENSGQVWRRRQISLCLFS